MTAPRQMHSTLAVIIGRAGSKGLPGKNWRPLCDRPLICHTIEDAQAATRIDAVLVSTDGGEIADAARSMGVSVIGRPAVLASDTATVDSAVRHAVDSSRSSASIIVILYASVPLRPDDLIDNAVRTLLETNADSVQSYSAVGKNHPYWMVTLDDHARVKPHVQNTVYRRQDLPPLLLPDGGVIAVRRDSLYTITPDQPHAFLGADRRGIISPPGSVVDVDTPTDFAMAEAMLRNQSSSLILKA